MRSRLIVVGGDLGTITGTNVSGITGKVYSGFNNGAWNGPGIVSSIATANTALGVAAAGEVGITTFAGIPVAPNDVLVMYTLTGDADLNATVNFNDLVRLAQNYNTTGKSWWQGDFTYDTVVNFNDLVKLAQNYNGTMPGAPIPGAPADFQHDLAAAFATVPEPATMPLLLLSACGFTAQRRRRRRQH
jgi:hypothetical protein